MKNTDTAKTPSYEKAVLAWMGAFQKAASLKKDLEREEKKMREYEALFPEIRNIAGLARKKRVAQGGLPAGGESAASSQGGAGSKKRKLDSVPNTAERSLVKGKLHSLVQRARAGKRKIQKAEIRQLFRELRVERVCPTKEEQQLLAEGSSVDSEELTGWYLNGVPAEPNPDLELEATKAALFPDVQMESLA